jgi:hypothetical protein
MQHDECKCSGNLEKLEIVDQYAENIAAEIADTVGGVCTPMFNFFVERLVARVAHMAVLSGDETLGPDNPKLFDAVERRLFQLSGTAPAALKIILDEARAKEGDTNARH